MFLEPFFGGSHKDFAEGLQSHSRHSIDLVTLPARFWKWRMRGAALDFIRRMPALTDYDGLIATDLMSLTDLKALCQEPLPPALVYFHENQLSYPLGPGEQMDYQFAFTNITTALGADRVVFNSNSHREDFLARLPGLIKMMPDARPNWVPDAICRKSNVLYPGCQFTLPEQGRECIQSDGTPPIIAWNHRWEFDKNPGDFFFALDQVLKRGVEFRLALLGENFHQVPPEFRVAGERYGDRIIQYGYVKSKREYQEWLRKSAIVVSTAIQENFGISIIEAVRYGCMPVLPNRLSYPEIIPPEFHGEVLYENREELVDRLCHMLRNLREYRETVHGLSTHMQKFSWENTIGRYDRELERMAARKTE